MKIINANEYDLQLIQDIERLLVRNNYDSDNIYITPAEEYYDSYVQQNRFVSYVIDQDNYDMPLIEIEYDVISEEDIDSNGFMVDSYWDSYEINTATELDDWNRKYAGYRVYVIPNTSITNTGSTGDYAPDHILDIKDTEYLTSNNDSLDRLYSDEVADIIGQYIIDNELYEPDIPVELVIYKNGKKINQEVMFVDGSLYSPNNF